MACAGVEFRDEFERVGCVGLSSNACQVAFDVELQRLSDKAHRREKFSEGMVSFFKGVGVLVDFTPVLGDVKGVVECAVDASASSCLSAAIGLIPVAGDLVGNGGKILLKHGDSTVTVGRKQDGKLEVTAEDVTSTKTNTGTVGGGDLNTGRNGSTAGSVADANFAQTSIRSDGAFSPDGQQIYSDLAGRPIRTVDDLTDALRNGDISVSDVPVDFVNMNGTTLVLNTRTSTALQNAGIPQSQWYGAPRTGQTAYIDDAGNAVTFDDLATQQLGNNGFPPTGSTTLPIGD